MIPTIGTIRLSDSIDFRPIRPNASNANFVFTSTRTPISSTDFNSSYSHYLERRDITVLSLNDSIKLIQGDSTVSTAFPSVPFRGMVLHKLRVLPYTMTNNSILIEHLDNKRYTMKDINRIDQRLRNVEYSVSLNSLEKAASSIVIPDANGLDRTKYGILAEDFTSTLLADVKSPDFAASIDIRGEMTPSPGCLMPGFFKGDAKMVANNSLALNVARFNDKILLAYNTSPAIVQTAATKKTAVAEYLFADFRGQMMTIPESDVWKYFPPLNPLNPPTSTGGGTVTPSRTTPGTYTGGGGGPIVPSKPITSNINVEQLFLYDPTLSGAGFTNLTYNKTTGQWVQANPGAGTLTNIPTVGTTRANAVDLIRQGAINAGYASSDAVYGKISDFMLSSITSMYQDFLGRPPDPQGAVYWASITAENNWTVEQMRDAGYKAAQAELAKTVTTNVNPVAVINTAGVASPVRPGTGVTYNSAYQYDTTPAGAARGPASTSMAGSTNYVTKDFSAASAVNALYETVLGRTADAAGAAYWTAQAETKGIQAVTQEFYNSAEYKSIGKK